MTTIPCPETPQTARPIAAELVTQIGTEIARLQQEAQTLRYQAALKRADAERQATVQEQMAAAAEKRIVAIHTQLAALVGIQAETVKTLVVGQLYDDKGIYMGTWRPRDRGGRRLGRTFNVFAAPTDLQDTSGNRIVSQFTEAVAHVATLRNWHGRDGGDFKNDTMLYKALEGGAGIGKWFIPPKELLRGTDLNAEPVYANSLFALRNTGDFKGTFDMTGSGINRRYPGWYSSCSEHRDHPSDVWVTRFSDGYEDWSLKDNSRFSSRVCFVELGI